MNQLSKIPQRDPGHLSESGPKCPVCLAGETRFFTKAADRLFGLAPGSYPLYRCTACECLFQHPMPDDCAIRQFYPETYWWDEEHRTSSGVAGILKNLEKSYREVVAMDHVRYLEHCARQAQGAGRSLLDVGCGSGTFLYLAQRRGFAAHGLDFSAQAVSVARSQYGLDVRQGAVGGDAWEGHRFDFITMFHVLEHLPEPRKALSFVMSRLKPGGSLVLQVPNVSSLQARLFGVRWYGLDAPRHVINLTPKGLQHLLSEAGLEGKVVSRFSLRDNPASLASSLVPGLDPIGRKGRRVRAGPLASVLAETAYFALVLAAFPFAFLESVAGFGGTLWAHARVQSR